MVYLQSVRLVATFPDSNLPCLALDSPLQLFRSEKPEVVTTLAGNQRKMEMAPLCGFRGSNFAEPISQEPGRISANFEII